MAIIRNCFVTAVMMVCLLICKAQTISYPTLSSQKLKSTAVDAAELLGRAIPGSQFNTMEYSNTPQSGMIFVYDNSMVDNQACKVESDGTGFIKFTAAEDNGLCFGFYQYLNMLGFRFYQPGTIWEVIPKLNSIYKTTDSIFTSGFEYNTWFVSGGCNRWVMDKSTDYSWDTYYGENGHNWALYQRRNGMTGAYRFVGHRGDLMTGAYMDALQNNPCYVANYNGSRQANNRSVPDINNAAAMGLWSSVIEQKYTQYKNNIHNNTSLYVNQFRNFKYNYKNIGIEVPDGAKWGNSTDNLGCNNTPYPSESDQQFVLSNFTAQKLIAVYPDSRFQLYAYSTHADVPSPSIAINSNIDVQLIPDVYQNITSTNGLRNRWYNRTKNISEYNYLNLSAWSGETPDFYLDEFKTTVQIAKEKNSQGLVWEASPAKFASLPYLLAASNNLVRSIPIDKTLQDFCNQMFDAAAGTIFQLLQIWTDSKVLAGGKSNKYKIPQYLRLLERAELETKDAPAVVRERLLELKAYLHYMILYFDWVADQRSNDAKQEKAAAICIYLAKTNRMQLVNSYFMIPTITSRYVSTSAFYQQYNIVNGTAYQNGDLPLITASEIENDYRSDLAKYSNSISDFQFESSTLIKEKLSDGGLMSQQKISVELKYTNGLDYYNKAEFFIAAPKAGSFTIEYTPAFNIPDKGYINFLVESTERVLEIIEDYTLNRNAGAGQLIIKLPSAGNYKLTVASKYKSTVSLVINTNKNTFYKAGSFFGKTTEVYADASAMPGYFYVPANLTKIYFSINNSNPAGAGFATDSQINNEFAILDNNGKAVKARFVTPIDSALFYIEIPAASTGKFYRFTRKSNYQLLFSNISNYLWYAQPKPTPCASANFIISVLNKNGRCVTRLTAVDNNGSFTWEVDDAEKSYNYANEKVVDLPYNISPNAVVTLTNGAGCSVTKKLKEDSQFLKAFEGCATGAPLPEVAVKPLVYPNPSSGIFYCMSDGKDLVADLIYISNSQGLMIADFKNTNRFNISVISSGIYWYKIVLKGNEYTGKLVKL